jgi:nucleoside-diphosphate-sugar epimerase
LKDGGFQVRGTVRDKNNEKKVAPLKEAFGDLFEQLELVEADLLNPESLDLAIAGCDYVVHTASPFPLVTPRDEQELIKPAVEGTLSVLRACHTHKVKRVVITSSIAAIFVQDPQNTTEKVYTELDYSFVDACEPYEKSKTLAE